MGGVLKFGWAFDQYVCLGINWLIALPSSLRQRNKLTIDIPLQKPDKLLPNVETELEDIITKVALLD